MLDSVATASRQPLSPASFTTAHPPLSSSSHAPPRAEALAFDVTEIESALAAMVRPESDWIAKFPQIFRPDIQFLLSHPSGKNLKTHQCMGVAHTETFKTADHTRVTPHTLLAAEIALEMAHHIKLDPHLTRDLIAAVAGHDQGHIFASHESELAINTHPDFAGTPDRPKYCHERRTKDLFESDDFVRHFGRDRINRITSVLYDSSHPLHIVVDWADRLAYLIADSLHLGHQDIIQNSHVRQDFIDSLTVLPDGTVGFSSLEPVMSLINARNMLYDRVSLGHTSALFAGFLREAYHRAITYQGTTATEFVRLISDCSTPEARQLFVPADVPRLFCPQQHPEEAKPVDLDYRAICHITLDMLSEKGRQWALEDPPVSPELTVPACSHMRANMSTFEHHIRSHFASAGGAGYLDRSGIIIGTSHLSPKKYRLRIATPTGQATSLEVSGKEKWELFLALPKDMSTIAAAMHRDVCDALITADLIAPGAKSKLMTIPASDFFTRY